ncbi:hypothetical protein ZIOFF_027501 [Zingiber officinale]|uniref:Uncharacterized protein n=1 Tax=Zingiber officinale TaxID=94328 RepID=A0A8J5GLQ2_ZINOF|nr:hypothetical protein ZIOFF_027501 [Zingiber officinale]
MSTTSPCSNDASSTSRRCAISTKNEEEVKVIDAGGIGDQLQPDLLHDAVSHNPMGLGKICRTKHVAMLIAMTSRRLLEAKKEDTPGGSKEVEVLAGGDSRALNGDLEPSAEAVIESTYGGGSIFSVPFTVTAQLAVNGGGGQGHSIGVLSISIVLPQVIIALSAGPWDALFGKGILPAFALASRIAFIRQTTDILRHYNLQHSHKHMLD